MLARFAFAIIVPKYGDVGSSVTTTNVDIGKTSGVSGTPLNIGLHYFFSFILVGNFSKFLMEISNKLWKKSQLKQRTIYLKAFVKKYG